MSFDFCFQTIVMEDSQKNLLKAVQDNLVLLRKQQGFDTALEFGNAAGVNENRNETYLVDYHLTTILKTVIGLGLKVNDLVTDAMIEKYKLDLERENTEREEKEKGE